MEAAAHRALGSSDRLVREREPAPLLGPGRPIASVYVDNFIGLGGDRDTSGRLLEAFEAECATLDLALHEIQSGQERLDLLGVEISGTERRLRNKARRVWRF